MGDAVDGEHAERQDGDDEAKKSQVEVVEPATVYHPVDHGVPAWPLVLASWEPRGVEGLAAGHFDISLDELLGEGSGGGTSMAHVLG